MAKKQIKKEKKVKKEKEVKVVKNNRDWNKILLITLLVLLIIGVVLIPLLVYSEIKTLLPIIAFLVLPILFGVAILLLSRNCFVDHMKKKEKVMNKVNIDG